ncbi:hypothetical protein FACS189443_3810 [Planctomycetales bacterium]|nr:hypothetical protein FACS189443_3810 [Planctomycetales bacterium]
MKLQNKLADGNMKLQGNMNYEWGESCAAQNEYIKAISFYEKAAGYGHTESKRKLEIITGIPPQIIVENSQQDTDTFVSRQEPDKTSLLPNSKFCPSCGTPVVTAAVICPRCGSAISGGGSGCSRVDYILLGVFLGGLGIHNFYAKRTGSAVAQLLISLLNGVIGIPLSVLTLGLFAPISIFASLTVFIWCIIEVCTVTKDGNGQPFV